MSHTYFTNCVNWPPDDVHVKGGLCDMIDEARTVTRRTFCRHVDRADREKLERAVGYEVPARRGYLSMGRDFFSWSAIEYVFRGAA
jgi:hypothetical protein